MDNSGNVATLALSKEQVTGTIPSELQTLDSLEFLDIRGTQLTACLLPELRRVEVPGPSLPFCSDAGLSVVPMEVYLDQELVVSGTGFGASTWVVVAVDFGGNVEPILGLVDSNEDGAWSLQVGPLGGVLLRFVDRMLEQVAVTLKAQDGHGTTATTTLNIKGASRGGGN